MTPFTPAQMREMAVELTSPGTCACDIYDGACEHDRAAAMLRFAADQIEGQEQELEVTKGARDSFREKWYLASEELSTLREQVWGLEQKWREEIPGFRRHGQYDAADSTALCADDLAALVKGEQ